MSDPGSALPLEQRIAKALDGAGDLSGPALLAHLRDVHGDDPELIAEVGALLDHASQENAVLDARPLESARTALGRLHDALASDVRTGGRRTGASEGSGASPQSLPATIGAYRIVRVIGEGGMGLVYEAEQPNPRRRVAIKVIGRGAPSRATLARFRNEAQVLGQLKHPGIAQIFEAATDPATGEAFFAMEYIDGPSLTRFASERNLSDRERVELAARVCDAVQHAHQKGVIHRDLKPGNILVESGSDGGWTPKVLDFGVAKLTEATSAGLSESATLALDANRIVGTLGYMSPEQFEGKPELLDTRSDVYSLGVILYELLAGRLPIEVKDLTLTQAATKVRQETPPRLGRARPSLRGDLEIITAKALSKEREARYASAAELAADLRRSLNHEPISARAPGTIYTLGKFARRKPGLTLASTVAFLALVGATVFSWVQYGKAESARRAEAEQALLANQRAQAELAARERADKAGQLTTAVKDFLLFQMIGAASPEKLGYEAKVLDVIKNAEEGVGKTFAGAPEIEAEIRFELARVYDTLGQWDKSLAQLDRSILIFTEVEGPEGPRTVRALGLKAIALANTNRFEESVPAARDALEKLARTNPNDFGSRVSTAASLGNALQALNRYSEAEPVLLEGIALAEAHLPAGNVTRLNIRSTYLAMLSAMDRADETVPQLKRLLAEQEASSGTDHPLSLTARNNLVNMLVKLKQNKEALEYALPMVEQAKRVFPEDHVHRGIAFTTVAAVLRRNQRPVEAAALAQEAFRNFSRANGDFAFFMEKAAEFAYLSHRQAKDAALARAWGLQYIACRFMGASESEFQSLKARLIEMAPSQGQEPTDAGAALILADLIAQADALVPPEAGRRCTYFANLARASFLLGLPEQARALLTQAEKDLPLSPRAESDRKLIDAAIAMTAPAANPK
ncbi:MAG: serine/threonine protein kinase [Phycisphaerae bacterium]|nr:serine/threonine protein kinase [Phycisphaerae bacterium]